MFFYIFFLFFNSFHSLLNCFYHFLSISQIFSSKKRRISKNMRLRCQMTHQRRCVILTLTHRARAEILKVQFWPSPRVQSIQPMREGFEKNCICQVQTFENAPRPVPKLKSKYFQKVKREVLKRWAKSRILESSRIILYSLQALQEALVFLWRKKLLPMGKNFVFFINRLV